MRIHAFLRRDEPFWLCCRTCANRVGDRCAEHGREIRWPRDWYGCGDYCTDGRPFPAQTTLEGWERRSSPRT